MARQPDQFPQLFVGTYAEPGGEGVYPLERRADGWALGEPFRGAPNASYGAYAPRFRIHYLLDEQAEGAVTACRLEAAGWRSLARVPTTGEEPCFAAVDPDERWLAVANYGSGTVALFGLDPHSGLPGDPVSVRGNAGGGPNSERQDGPHAHCTVFDPPGQWLYQTDLGTDQIRAFRFDRDSGALGEPTIAFAAPPGSGPRHLVFHPTQPLAVLVTELSSELRLLDVGDGVLTERQSLSTLPEGFSGESLGGHLEIDASGNRVFVTNRGHDSIAVFALEDGSLHPVSHTPSGGASPRQFVLLEAHGMLLVANEEGNSVTAFAVNDDGTLSPSGEVAVPGAAYVFAVPSVD